MPNCAKPQNCPLSSREIVAVEMPFGGVDLGLWYCFQYIYSYSALLKMSRFDRLLCQLCRSDYAESHEPHLFYGVAQK